MKMVHWAAPRVRELSNVESQGMIQNIEAIYQDEFYLIFSLVLGFLVRTAPKGVCEFLLRGKHD